MIYQMITTNMTNDYTNMSKTKSIKQQICVCSLKATHTHTGWSFFILNLSVFQLFVSYLSDIVDYMCIITDTAHETCSCYINAL